ncbi:guanylate-binding protein 1-like [Mercenaria mercenaria]|uniref:guanylate-binding protein 1-like n=1 Tax=Mercenaria mercenaria TaxID=6596 RepID=UPI00234F3791|nr:guanylate-binding protein 1-like [Mercenaria mercenaria]
MLHCEHCTFLNDFDEKECTMCFNRIDPNTHIEKCEHCTVFIEPGTKICHICGNTQKKYLTETQYEAGKKKTGNMKASNVSQFFGSEMADDDITIVTRFDRFSVQNRAGEIDIYSKPRCLVYTDEEGLLAINTSVLTAISQIECPLNVVSICGVYRTGKSYLMNRLAGEREGFSLGDTIQSETKGIWIWCKKHPNRENEVLLLIDTEGLADPEKGDKDHDNKLFCLTLLLSSTMLLNVSGAINYDTWSKLAFITNLTSNVHVLTENDDQQFNASHIKLASPHLIVCVRDFHLEKIRDNKKITEDEYLEDSLKTSTKKNQEKNNEIKTSIKNYFPSRKCFTIAQPAMGKTLNAIECQPDDRLEEEFIENVQVLIDYVNKCEPKYISNASKKTIDGADFASYATTYVNAFRMGSTISLKKAYDAAAERRNRKVLKAVLDEYQKTLERIELPKRKQDLQTKFLVAFDQGLARYRSESLPYRQEKFEEEAKAEMQHHFEDLTKRLTLNSQKEGKRKLEVLYRDMLSKHESEYDAKDGYERYTNDMAQLEKDFFSEMKDYDKDDLYLALRTFKENEQSSRMVWYNDETRNRDSKQFGKLNEEFRKAITERMEKAYKANAERREKYMNEQMAKLKTEYDLRYSKLQEKEKSSCIIL